MLAIHSLGLSPPSPLRRHATGVPSVDAALAGGIAYGRVHEIHAAEADDLAGAAGFAAIVAGAMAIGEAQDSSRPLLWLRTAKAARAAGMIQGEGWRDLGGSPNNCLFVLTRDAKQLLRATVDALRSGSIGALIAETVGNLPELDLTASRRLSLAAEKSGIALFLLRGDGGANPSAAETRWRVAAAPSRALPAQAPGAPVFDLELLRQRSGPSGMRWQLEWDRDRSIFIDAATAGTLVSAPVRRPSAAAGTNPARFGQRAA
jgi:protein ImuA